MPENYHALKRQFGIEIPIVQGPMGGVAGPRLVAAVCNAGGLGILPIWSEPVKAAVSAIEQVKSMTDRPFAVNLRADLVQLEHIAAATDAGVEIIHLFWGNPAASRQAVVSGGARMIATVGDPEAAKVALDAGACALIAQGAEAGGHVLGNTAIAELLACVLNVAGQIPVIAAGGCADGEDARQLMELGAAGVLLGTRFVACEESDAHSDYKKAIIEAVDESTARSLCFDIGWPDAPHRTLINSTFRAWDEAGRPAQGERPGEGDIILRSLGGREIPRYAITPPRHGMTGDIRAAAMYAGTGASRIADCPSAAEIVAHIGAKMAPG